MIKKYFGFTTPYKAMNNYYNASCHKLTRKILQQCVAVYSIRRYNVVLKRSPHPSNCLLWRKHFREMSLCTRDDITKPKRELDRNGEGNPSQRKSAAGVGKRSFPNGTDKNLYFTSTSIIFARTVKHLIVFRRHIYKFKSHDCRSFLDGNFVK